MLLTEEQAKKVFAGSYESTISALACAATKNGWSLVSTSPDHAHLIEDGELVRRGYSIEGDEVKFGRAAKVKTLPETDAVGIVAERINSLASRLISGEPLSATEAVMLSRHSKEYMSHSAAFEVLEAPALSAYYEDNKSEIRKSAWGKIGEIETESRVTSYGRMSTQRQEAHRQEILDCLNACAETLESLDCSGDGHVSSLLARFKADAQKASAIIRHSGLPIERIAESADSFSKSLRTATLLREYQKQEGK